MEQNGREEEQPELELEYPAVWTYTVFGRDEELMRQAISHVIDDQPHTVAFSNQSAGGKYRSLQIEVTVQSNDQRLRTFQRLHEHEHILYVL